MHQISAGNHALKKTGVLMCHLGRCELIADAENFGNDYATKNNKEYDVTSFVN